MGSYPCRIYCSHKDHCSHFTSRDVVYVGSVGRQYNRVSLSTLPNIYEVGVKINTLDSNPYNTHYITPKSKQECVELFKAWLIHRIKTRLTQIEELEKLRGKNIACNCPLDQPCHGDFLLEICNRSVDEWPWTLKAPPDMPKEVFEWLMWSHLNR